MSSDPADSIKHPSSRTTFKTNNSDSTNSSSTRFTPLETSPDRSTSSSPVGADHTAMAGDVASTLPEPDSKVPTSEGTKATGIGPPNPEPSSSSPPSKSKVKKSTGAQTKKTDSKSHKIGGKKKSKKRSRANQVETSSSSDSSTSDSSDSSDSEESEESSSDDEAPRRKKKGRSKKAGKLKSKINGRAKAEDSESDSSTDSGEESTSSEDEKPKSKKSKKNKKMKAKKKRGKNCKKGEDSDEDSETENDIVAQLKAIAAGNLSKSNHRKGVSGDKKSKKGKGKPGKKGSKVDFVRIDRIWDSSRHNFVLKPTAKDLDVGEYDQYVFQVRRKFDWENKYQNTELEIKSKALKQSLRDVMKDVKGVSFAEDTPIINPNTIFLYLEEIRTHMKKLKKLGQMDKNKTKKKGKMPAATKAEHTKVLVKYLDKDYADTKKTLYPLLESKKITYDLLWALFKSNEIAYCETYDTPDEPRAFKIEYANPQKSLVKGDYYKVEGRYLEYDGKIFGLGAMEVEVPEFTGPRLISTLACYPLKYHKDAANLKEQLVERGKKFVCLKGVQYQFHKGMAFYKKKRQIVKVNVNGRVMADPATHRRIQPNYPISTVKAADHDILESDEDDSKSSESSDKDSSSSSSSDEEGTGQKGDDKYGNLDKPILKWKLVEDGDGHYCFIQIEVDGDGNVIQKEDLEQLPGQDGAGELEFTEEELLIASPVVLGFAFSEKLWLELTVSGIHDIDWNYGAYESLVLPDNHKAIVEALVRSHTFEASRNIDDVIQGKGRGLVSILHGSPGLGKTLTAEGIAELLKRPLYMVSVGELGTSPRHLEAELTKILDVAHSWGAVLLLDEADVFLEARRPTDVARNALVSIFLRLLEYFQGILFLTTNRVQEFDPAFQSRIHIALRYGELTPKAKRTVWKNFINKVVALDGVQVEPFSDEHYDRLCRRDLNGRQIKNAVRTGQALAIDEKKPLSIEHIIKVLDVAQSFERDLKGGPGYEDAMRSYH